MDRADVSNHELTLLSVVIPNYNYGRFVADAVDSALSLDWPRVQVIVVDDGSDDESLDVLRSFGDRITLIAQENAGPRVACNRGFAASHGDAVIFLDSDDVLEPGIVREVAKIWHSGVSKVQVQMRRLDAEGKLTKRTFPPYRTAATPTDLRRWLLCTSAYPTPPGSGNVYSRQFLEQLFPLDDRCGDATDSACLAAAPLLGDVLTIAQPLVRYRVHGNNRSSLVADPTRFRRQIERAHQRQRVAISYAGGDETDVVRSLRKGRHLLQMRIAENRMCSGTTGLPGDEKMSRLLWDTLRSPLAPGPESASYRLAVVAWALAVLAVPHTVARRMITRRFS